MAKIALATTERSQLDLYCVGAGQSQWPRIRHDDQDKIYYVLEGTGRSRSVGSRRSRCWRVKRWSRRRESTTDSSTKAPEPLLVLVVVTPPPPHGKGPTPHGG